MHKLIAKYLLYYPMQQIRSQEVWRYLDNVVKVQYLPLEEINAIRDKKIRQVLQSAYQKIPYYKKRFDDCGANLQSISGYEGLDRLPVLSKKEILAHEKDLIDADSSARLFLRKTGGSTGITLHFMKEASALALNDAIMYRCYAWYNIDIGDKQVRFWGVPVDESLRRKEWIKDILLNRIRISAFDISVESCRRYFQQMKRFKPVFFYGYTTAIYGFAYFARELGFDLNSLNLRAVICTAEKMYPHHRELFNEVFKCPVVDEYGSSENGIIAFQCREGNMHMMGDHLSIEFLDEHDKRVQPGELGRIVVTDLAAHAMPLIRYDIGDMGRYTNKTCSCGINLPLMEIVEGRKEDFIRTREGKLVHAAYLCYTLKNDAVHAFKMYQKAMDRFLVQIVKSPSFKNGSEKKLEQNLRSSLGHDVQIEFEYLENIPLETSGKLRYFVSELKS